MMLSSTPVTVTVCGVFQFAGVKVSVVTESVPSVRSPLVKLITTSDAGCALSTTVNASLVAASEVPVLPPLSAMVKPGESLSVLVTETV